MASQEARSAPKVTILSYDADLPTDVDKARAMLGDTSNDAATELLTDDHITAVLAWKGSFDAAVGFLAQELASRFAQQPGSVSLPSGLSVSWASRVRTWQDLANALGGAITYTAFSVAPGRDDGYAAYAAENP